MAKHEIEYHPAAIEEVVDALEWYSSIDSKTGLKFKTELARAEKLIQRSPASWGPYFYRTKGFRFRGFRLL